MIIMTKREQILYRGMWNKYRKEYHKAYTAECRKLHCEKLITLEEILEELTKGELNDSVFDSWEKAIIHEKYRAVND